MSREAERAALAARLSERFAEFNRLYFGGRLPQYRILISSAAGAGDCNRRLRRIRLAEAPTNVMVGRLVHEMTHAAVGYGHGQRFKAELQRLRAAGAPAPPVDVDLQEPIGPTAASVRNGIDDAMIDGGCTLRQAQRHVADWWGLSRAKLIRRFPRAAKGTPGLRAAYRVAPPWAS